MTQPEQPPPLAAMATALADGYIPSDLERKILTLELIGKAMGDEANPASWVVIGRVLGMDGKAAKRHVRELREEVRRAQAAAGDGEG